MYKKSNIYIVLIGVLLCCSIGRAQRGPTPFLLHWTENDGLCDDQVFKLIKDAQGWIWVASANGLCRFDGKEFYSYRYDPQDETTVSANQIIRLMEDHRGNIWVATDGGGLSKYDYKKDQFKTLRQNLNQPERGLLEDRVYGMIENKNHDIVIGYRAIGSGKGGLTFLDSSFQIQQHFLQNKVDYANFPLKVTQILPDDEQDAVYWLGGRSFFCWNQTTNEFQEFPHPGFKPNFTSVNGIVEATDSTLFVAQAYDGIWLFDKKNKKWLHQLHQNPIRSIFKNRDGKLWFADDKGIGWLTPNNTIANYEFLIHQNSPFQPGTQINSINMMDGNLWIATNTGLYCWNPIFQQFNVDQIQLNENTSAYWPFFVGALSANEWLFADRTKGLFITDSLLEVQQLIAMPQKASITKAALVSINDLKFVLVGTNKGLFKWQVGSRNIEPYLADRSIQYAKNIEVWSIHIDQQRYAWIGTRVSGFLKIDLLKDSLTQFLSHPENQNSLCHNKYLFEIEKDRRGNLWIGTDNGLSIYNPSANQFKYIPELEPIQNFVIHSLEPDDQNNMWIGTRDQGLFLFQIEDKKLKHFTVKNGLPYNGVNRMLYKDSTLWLGTQNGLSKMNMGNQQVINFNQRKGLFQNSLYAARLSSLPDGDLFLSYQNSKYISKFKPAQIQESIPGPVLDLNVIRILGKTEKERIIISDKETVNLKASENYFAIDFNAIDFFEPRSITYQYKMEGFDQVWIQAHHANSAIYTNLPGGNYRFKVKAANKDGQWSATKELTIKVATYWYKSNWFFLLLLLLSGGLIYGIYRIRTAQIRKEEHFKQQLAETEMKALRSQINPHFIFNCLNSIKSYIIENKIEDGSEFIGRFSQLIRMILNHSKEKLIPLSKEIEALRLYTWLEQERLKHRFDVSFEINLQQSSENIMVPPLLFQPFIENAIWHGLVHLNGKGKLVIKIDELKEYIEIHILDNGIGRKASAESKQKSVFSKPSLGIELSVNRLEQVNRLYGLQSKVSIEDQYPNQNDTGTKVKIEFPKLKSTGYASSNHRG